MTQEFRTFIQRLTDGPNKTTHVFNVQAKAILDRFGNDVVDSKGNKIWFPVTFDPAAAIAFGGSLASRSPVTAVLDFGRNVRQGGAWDLQHSYNGQLNGPFWRCSPRRLLASMGLLGPPRAESGATRAVVPWDVGSFNAPLQSALIQATAASELVCAAARIQQIACPPRRSRLCTNYPEIIEDS